jgi:hypothetical protein
MIGGMILMGKFDFWGPKPLTVSFRLTSRTGWPGTELVTNRPSHSMTPLNHLTLYSKHSSYLTENIVYNN